MKRKYPRLAVWVLIGVDGNPHHVTPTRKQARGQRINGERIYKYILG